MSFPDLEGMCSGNLQRKFLLAMQRINVAVNPVDTSSLLLPLSSLLAYSSYYYFNQDTPSEKASFFFYFFINICENEKTNAIGIYNN